MTRPLTQMLLIGLYGLTGLAAFLAPDTTARVIGFTEVERANEALHYLMRLFGAAAGLVALLLFFFIANAAASKRLMLTVAIYEGLVIAATAIAYGANDIGGRTTAVSVIGSAILALLNLWGVFFADRSPEVPAGEAA